MDDFTILVGILASGSITINMWLIKSMSSLCTRLSRIEGKLMPKHE